MAKYEWIVEIDDDEGFHLEDAKWKQELVRCKDCVYGEPNGQYGCKCYHHKLYEVHEMSPNDFCSKGKRKEDV